MVRFFHRAARVVVGVLCLGAGACSEPAADRGANDTGADTGSCQPGTESCTCLSGELCQAGLACVMDACVAPGQGEGSTSGPADTSGATVADGSSADSTESPSEGTTPEEGDTGESATASTGDSGATGEGGEVDPFGCDRLEYPVNVVGAGGYDTLAAAVAAAPPDATIEVCPGTYVENLVIERNLTLRGSGAEVTAIDGGGAQSTLFVDAVDLTLADVTITGGAAHLNPLSGPGTCGGGLAIEYADGQQITIDDCVFTNNTAGRGAAICADGTNGANDADLVLTRVRIHDNAASVNGAGVFSYSDLTLDDCEIVDNVAGNHGGGLYLAYGVATVTGGVVRNNVAMAGGGAYLQSPMTLEVTDSDWGEGAALENDPDDVGCYTDSFGFFGADATFACSVPEFDECACG